MIEVPDFEALYRRQPDPWGVGTSFYERRKLDLVLAALSRARYARAWDPGCGTGHLAARLSARCDAVLATDLVPAAVELARETCAGISNVALHRWSFPSDGRPGGDRFDLVVLSEFVYYLPEDERAAIPGLLDEATEISAEALAVHWRHRAEDAWLSGAEVQRELADQLSATGWRLQYRVEDVEFELAGWRRGHDGDRVDQDHETEDGP